MTLEATAILALAIILSAFCAILGQPRSKQSSATLVESLVVSGLGLGTLLTPSPINRYFLVGVLGVAAYSLFKVHCTATMRAISLGQVALAIVLSLAAPFTSHSLAMVAGLLVAATLVPLPPFHVPFASLVSSSQGSLPILWTTVLLSLGLAELMGLQTFLSAGMPAAISWLALGSALYASFKCLGQRQIRTLLSYAVIAHVSMLWGLTTVFSTFSPMAHTLWVNHCLGHDRSPFHLSLHSTEVWVTCHRNPARLGPGHATLGGVAHYPDQHRRGTSHFSDIGRLTCPADYGQSGCLPRHHFLDHPLRVDGGKLVFFTCPAPDSFWKGQAKYSLQGFERRGNQRGCPTYCCSQL